MNEKWKLLVGKRKSFLEPNSAFELSYFIANIS